MRKDEIEYHSDGPYRPSVPAVNVKVSGTYRLVDRLGKYGYGDFSDESFPAWLEDADESTMQWAWDMAVEAAWDHLQTDAEEIFGLGTKVYAQGRSGGWAVIDGLTREDVESWDAIELAKWARFSKWARQQADDVPYLMIDTLYHNVFLPRAEAERSYGFGAYA